MPRQTILSEALAHQAPIGILQLGLDGGITYANPAFCKLIGYTEAQLRRLDNRAISHPEDFAAEVRVVQQMLDQGQRQQVLQKRYRRCDGDIVWVEVKLSLVDDPETGDAVILSFITNNTDRRLIEQERQQYARELEDQVSERTRSRVQALKFEQLVHHLTETLRQHLDADPVLQAAVKGLTQALNADRCFISLMNAEKDCLTVRHEYVRDAMPPLPSLQGQSFSPQSLAVADGCERQQTDLKQDIDRTSHFSNLSSHQRHDEHVLALAGEPTAAITQLLFIEGNVFRPIRDHQAWLGILAVCCSQARTFEPNEIALIEQVSSQCAIALRQSELHAQQHDLRVSSDYFRSFLETLTDVFIEYDSSLRCLSMNPAGSTMLELAPEAIVGKTNQELFGEAAERLDATIQRAFDTGEKVFVDHELLLAEGSRVFETVYTPITAPSGAVQRVIGVSRDVTELKQQWQLLETQNQQLTETTRVKQEFIATTSHELRTPLTAVLGFSNVLLQGFFGELNPKQNDYVERIHDSGQHLLDLINDILDLSRLEADRLELDRQAIFVPDVCEGVMSLIRERALNQGLKIDVDLDSSVDWVVADPRRLKQMLLNLLANAIKFTQEGTIGLKVYRQPLPRCVNHAIEAELPEQLSPCGDRALEMIRFLVWDTGIGIDAANQQKLFSPFSQIDSSLARNHQGTGLGLVITRKLAELHGGTVTLESSPNQGARFTIALPFHPTV
ncbi:MAG: PAS domain S-box protein [Tildeniella nuda ZEHNDER 1965/U140]|nr:PAS domain S-box protein [Tildeniella nuda ZEHNDER 1965/U140]